MVRFDIIKNERRSHGRLNQERQGYTRRADVEHVRHDGCLIEAVDRQRVSTDAEFKAQLSAERANCLALLEVCYGSSKTLR